LFGSISGLNGSSISMYSKYWEVQTNSGDKLGEGIDLESGLKIFTINGAMAMMHEDVTGSIQVGKHADMILLDRNLFEIDSTEISDVKVLQTIFAGVEVYQME